MDFPFNKRDLAYTLISRFETGFRCFIDETLCLSMPDFLNYIPQRIVVFARERSGKDTWDSVVDFLEDINFSDLKKIVLCDYRSYFNNQLMKQSEFEAIMNELYSLRCKIAHIRQYFTSFDLDKLIDNSTTLAQQMNMYGAEYLSMVEQLKTNTDSFEVLTCENLIYCDEDIYRNVPNNLPVPDYEYEGGFVGREDDIKQIIRLIKAKQVVTISGAGGVGKTALALKIIDQIHRNEIIKLDGIIWLSAKDTKLSYLGIDDVLPTVKNYEQLLDAILSIMGFKADQSTIDEKENDCNTVFEMHQCILIVIDNFETILDDSVVNFILDCHSNVKILITSRKGLGQIERRYDLQQMKENDAVYLFRLIARDKNLKSLSDLPEEKIRQFVCQLCCYPLAIKWVIGKIALGHDINEVISSIKETTSDISLFCFEEIYKDLSSQAKTILCSISCLDDLPSAGVLKYVADLSQDDFEDGIQELVLVSLIIPDQVTNDRGGVDRHFSLLSLTKGYVRNQLDKDINLKRIIGGRLKQVETHIEDAERAYKEYQFSLSYMGAVTDEEKVAAMIAQAAYQKYQSGNYNEALEDYKRACSIAPKLASIYRNWAMMESQEYHILEADKLMEKASSLDPNDAQIWLTWGNIKRRNDKVKEALKYYEKAHAILPNNSVILNALGQAKCRLGDYAEADKLFHAAYNSVDATTQVRHEIVNYTSIADNLKRWAEALIRGRDYGHAEVKLNEALSYIKKVITIAKSDKKARDLERSIHMELGLVLTKKERYEESISHYIQATAYNPNSLREIRDHVKSSIAIGKIYIKLGNFAMAGSYVNSSLLKFKLRENPEFINDVKELIKIIASKLTTHTGIIIRVCESRGYAIIGKSDDESKTYLAPIKEFDPPLDRLDPALFNTMVEFTPHEEVKNGITKQKAMGVRLVDMNNARQE
ncbi:MAG TPA: NB-ARC domain-containing protein [Candidatus Syntrophosphaera sp.]|nr:NB-ARC domain-containing protein [Candidatus Syntrophosphaera sp.]